MTPRKTSSRAKAPEPDLRHLWLAGLGAVAIARREGARRLEQSRQDIERIARRAQASLRAGLAEARAQGEARVERFGSEVEARLAPVLDKLGVSRPRKATTRRRPARQATAKKPAAKKPGARKRTARRSA